jgi:hypothetical protein
MMKNGQARDIGHFRLRPILFIRYRKSYSGITKETKRTLRDDSDDFEEIPGNRRNLQEGFPKAN